VLFRSDDRLTGQVWVTVVATGIGRAGRVRPRQFEAPLPTMRDAIAGARHRDDDIDVPSFLR